MRPAREWQLTRPTTAHAPLGRASPSRTASPTRWYSVVRTAPQVLHPAPAPAARRERAPMPKLHFTFHFMSRSDRRRCTATATAVACLRARSWWVTAGARSAHGAGTHSTACMAGSRRSEAG
jgi:hypothetical protein